MYTTLLLLCSVIVVSAVKHVSSSVVKQVNDSCSPTEFLCGDGGCVSSELVCDGSRDCADGADELSCHGGLTIPSFNSTHLYRSRRQASRCRWDQWQCQDGSCISFDGKCDGIVDCGDRSDETHALCRKTPCLPHLFRCTYGACVDGTAPCNKIKECADNSDELLPKCRNEPNEVRGTFSCKDGSSIPASNHCDGVKDCLDGSDETLQTCAAKKCQPNLFQCAYGACVDGGSDCNKIVECADGSDEEAELCGLPITPKNRCKIPENPSHGTYTYNHPNARPGDAFDFIKLEVSCEQGYGIVGPSFVFCEEGSWLGNIPQCVRFCKLMRHISVEHTCIDRGPNRFKATRPCKEYEPDGIEVEPKCRYPNYYSATTLPLMRCIDGIWDYTAICSPECGTVTPDGTGLIIGGVSAKYAEVPWHAAIYSKEFMPYKQICGGSLISNTIILSAAHCFWDKVQNIPQPANLFAVGVGKLYRSWVDPEPPPGVIFPKSQTADVLAIHIADRYQDSAANYQADIAVVVVATSFKYETYIRPVCINFDIRMENSQLQPGLKGLPQHLVGVAGWGLTAENGTFESQILKVTNLSYVSPSECIYNSPKEFQSYITSDKICAGDINDNTALCRGDSGGGLTFPQIGENNTPRYHLRGIVSTASKDGLKACNAHTYTTFTQILKHEDFIKKHWRV